MARRIVAALVIAALAGAAFWYATSRRAEPARPRFSTNDPVERGCKLPKEQLVRLWRGHHPVHSEDVTIVPAEPNYSGAFTVTSHSGPWDYVQTVPLVFYGPGSVPAAGRVEREATVADVFPWAGVMTGVDLPPRAGRLPDELGAPPPAPPKLIVTVVWDGVGRNVLERWPGRWPVLERLEAEGTSFVNATVGSSPSITPAIHSTIGTGDFPLRHGVTAIEYREASGEVRGAFAGRDPSDLKLTTFADEIDRALGNEPLVGMLAWKSWHMGMLSHGTHLDGGDADHLALIGTNGPISGNTRYYSTPGYLAGFGSRLQDHLDEADRADGSADGAWMGHPVHEVHDNPGWVTYETDALLTMLEREGYGADEVTDLFFTNYKMTDIVAHQHGMESDEMGEVVEAQDAALGQLVEWLDDNVGDYALVLTSDHGNTRRAEDSGAWPLLQGQLQADVDAHFGAPEGSSLIDTTTAAGPFINREVALDLGVTSADIARFLNAYTIRDNWAEQELPDGYEDRGDEQILAAAFASNQYEQVMTCAFGTADERAWVVSPR